MTGSWILGVVCTWLLSALVGLGGGHRGRPWLGGVVAAGALVLVVVALLSLAAPTPAWLLPAPFAFGSLPVKLQWDPLAGWFVLVIGLVAMPTAVAMPSYLEHGEMDRRVVWFGFPLLLASLVGVVLAANVLTFVAAWEVMSLSSLCLVACHHHRRETRRAATVYAAATRLGTAFLLAGMLWAHGLSGSWDFADWHLQGPAALAPALLILVALATKAGLWPFHLWLPVAHPAAPAPVSAVMSGVMLKVAVYAIIRLFVVHPAFSHPWLSIIILALGTVSAFWGVCFALLQHDLKRLLAYHSIENVGLIVMGLGISMTAPHAVAGLALAAALLHTLNHALFKSLLFLGAGAVDWSAHTRDLDLLGGLGSRMPTTFACFVIGSAAICGLPPLNGFASEWLLYQGTLGMAMAGSTPAVRFVALLGVGWVALVGALALACFVKVVGVVFQGRPRSEAAAQAREVPGGLRAAQVMLAGLCVEAGLGVPALLEGLRPILGDATPVWTLPMGTVFLLLLLTVGALAAWLRRDVRRYITWECGFGDLGPRMQVTATSFVQPIARMFGPLYRYAIHLHVDGPQRQLFPESITVEAHTESVLALRIYRPLWHAIEGAADRLARVQTGSIHLYLLTMGITLIVLLSLGVYGP